MDTESPRETQDTTTQWVTHCHPRGNGDSNLRDPAASQGTSGIPGAHQKLEEGKEGFFLQASEGT